MSEPNNLLYKNNRIKTLYFVTMITIAMPLLTYYMVFQDIEELKSEFSSKTTFILWMIFIFVCSHAMLIAILWMHQRYILKITKIDNDSVEIKTWSIIGLHARRIYTIDILDKSVFMEGRANFPVTPIVNAPWLKLKTPNNRTLILDLQGEFNYPSIRNK